MYIFVIFHHTNNVYYIQCIVHYFSLSYPFIVISLATVKVDCKIGPWGDWYAVKGAPGNYARHRPTLVHPINGGHPCPPCTEYKVGKYSCGLHIYCSHLYN